MQTFKSQIRPNWVQRCMDRGFSYHSIDGLYWQEAYAYSFTSKQIEIIKKASKECHFMMLDALDDVIKKGHLEYFSFPDFMNHLIEDSWKNRSTPEQFSLYGRFDFSWDGGPNPKMLEYNADIPTGLLEGGVVQADWYQDVYPKEGQFNQIHSELVKRFKTLKNHTLLHLACSANSEEDMGNLRYMQTAISDAGIETDGGCLMTMPQIGFDEKHGNFFDGQNRKISQIFKLYPWEWIAQDQFGPLTQNQQIQWIEPAYKAALSCKAMLPFVWLKNKNHPNLLACEFEGMNTIRFNNGFVKKPLFSREGANVSMFTPSGEFHANGLYGKEGYIIQELAQLPQFDGRFTCVGSWMVGDTPAGLGIREDFTPITKDTSLFIPHIIRD